MTCGWLRVTACVVLIILGFLKNFMALCPHFTRSSEQWKLTCEVVPDYMKIAFAKS